MKVGEKIGPFTIERELGQGAMGTVYKAIYEREDGRQAHVALKVVSYGLQNNEGAMARFDREAAILKQLRHPHIVRLIATGKYKKLPFIAMEFVDGEALDRVLHRRERLGWEDVVTYGKHLCEALQHAHEKGIIHRDLKPSNLMLTKDGRLKLTDFGIAKDTDVTALTAQNNTIGTAAYMSPEQCRGDKSLSNKSDLYSLGVVFYELITGKKPFVAETTMDLFLKHVNDKPVRPAKIVPDLPVWMDNLVMFLMEKDKEQRPLDAATVGKMLTEIEEKVAAGVSAGETVAKSRKIDRKLGEGTLDEDDKANIKAIRGKKKKKARPWYEAGWVRAVPLVLALVGIGGAVAYVAWPEGMDKRFKRIEDASSPEDKLAAATSFLSAYRGSADPKVEQARKVYQEQIARDKERVLLKRLNTKFEDNTEGFDPDLYPDALAALKAERAGRLDEAARLWTGIQNKSGDVSAKLPDDGEAAKACLGWIAASHLSVIRQGVPELEKKLAEQIASSRTYETGYKSDGPEGAATRAMLFDEYGDKSRAKTAWTDLVTQGEKEADKRWMLLAARRVVAQGDATDNPEARAKTLRDLLTSHQKTYASKPDDQVARRTVFNTAREIVMLYDADPSDTVKPVVAMAKKLVEQTAKKGSGG